MHVEEVREIELLCAWPARGARSFRPGSSYSDIRKCELRHELLFPICLHLFHIDGAQRCRVGDGMMRHVQFPKHANEADSSTDTVDVETAIRWMRKMDIPDSGSESRPTESIGRRKRTQRR